MKGCKGRRVQGPNGGRAQGCKGKRAGGYKGERVQKQESTRAGGGKSRWCMGAMAEGHWGASAQG